MYECLSMYVCKYVCTYLYAWLCMDTSCTHLQNATIGKQVCLGTRVHTPRSARCKSLSAPLIKGSALTTRIRLSRVLRRAESAESPPPFFS